MSGSSLIPSLRYHDAHGAITWLCDMLGFQKAAVYDGPENTVAHAQLTLGSGMIMLGSASNPSPYPHALATPDELGGKAGASIYVIVPDCKPVYERVEAARAEIVMPLQTMDYGGQSFTVRDPEGYLWSLGEYDPWAAHEASQLAEAS